MGGFFECAAGDCVDLVVIRPDDAFGIHRQIITIATGLLDRFEEGGLGFFGAPKRHETGAKQFPALEVIGIFKQAV